MPAFINLWRNTLNKKHVLNIFLAFIAILAFGLIYKFYDMFGASSIPYIIFWLFLAIISESFLIVSPSGVGTSVAGAVYIYIGIVANPFVVMFVGMIGCILRFPEIDGKREYIMNTNKKILIFNSINIGLTYGLSTLVFQYAPQGFNLLYIMPLTILVVLVAEGVNFLSLSTMLKIMNGVQYRKTFKSILDTISSTFAVSMLGIFLAFADNQYGKETVILFFIPLLLARYSFKLYFDSQRMALETIHALNEALHAKDAYTGGHTGRVEQYSVDLAEAYGLSQTDVEVIRTAALLHDIGKIGIPDDILNKPGKLSNHEYEQIQEHSSIGAKILGNVDSLKKVSQIIVQHHERYDGNGYPCGLTGREIGQEASILMIADSFDAMTTDRPYRKALSLQEAINELRIHSGSQFHPELTECFIEKVLSKKPEEYINSDAHINKKVIQVEG